jgi:hypothetical protein
MSPKADELLKQIMLLTPTERAQLAGKTLASLGNEEQLDLEFEKAWQEEAERTIDPEINKAWLEVAKRRDAEIESGRVQPIPWEVAREQIRKRKRATG